MKKLLATAALALSFAAVGVSAQAATTAITFASDSNTDIGNTILQAKGTTFTDYYTFTYNSSFDVSSAIISMALGTTSKLQITGFTLTDLTTNTVYTGTGGTIGGASGYSIEAANLTSGNYVLTVTGKVLGTTGGSYGGNISISAVPEASTISMMLGGLALVGGMAWRRRRSEQGKQLSNQTLVAA